MFLLSTILLLITTHIDFQETKESINNLTERIFFDLRGNGIYNNRQTDERELRLSKICSLSKNSCSVTFPQNEEILMTLGWSCDGKSCHSTLMKQSLNIGLLVHFSSK